MARKKYYKKKPDKPKVYQAKGSFRKTAAAIAKSKLAQSAFDLLSKEFDKTGSIRRGLRTAKKMADREGHFDFKSFIPTESNEGDILHDSHERVSTSKLYGEKEVKTIHRTDRFSSRKSKYMESAMNLYGDSLIDQGALNGPNQISYCGFNRQGVMWPTIDPTGINYPFGFTAKDYDFVFGDRIPTTLTDNLRPNISCTFPMSRKSLTLNLVSCNKFFPINVKIYVLKSKTLRALPAMSYWYDRDKSPTPSKVNVPFLMDTKYVYLPTKYADGTYAETSVHLKATPFIGTQFEKYYSLEKLHKIKLLPGDSFEYNLEVNLKSGISLNDWYEAKISSADQPIGQPQFMIGDYQLMVTFEGVSCTAIHNRSVSDLERDSGLQNYVTSFTKDKFLGTSPCAIQWASSKKYNCSFPNYEELVGKQPGTNESIFLGTKIRELDSSLITASHSVFQSSGFDPQKLTEDMWYIPVESDMSSQFAGSRIDEGD